MRLTETLIHTGFILLGGMVLMILMCAVERGIDWFRERRDQRQWIRRELQRILDEDAIPGIDGLEDDID